ncbi:NADH dehydrogenase [ubiquinone] 1 beta subcomplex subunit 10-like [Macrosteles quadrilineatus]|uniref:NADH dehydrogenase [ubiquinone] 1 beta subcomplex subunit 10-like n=1 Tax=Macrosteles quadrilineatus TaxID=74068 RepID=UPI0023E3389B|nr:NADH dehydrogenase [ubiquinone] 1 beta subcomplex subunit 10-like [Macrosteles quadrilineatus]XP_054284157.1 NADH dehydrogenase [ubiquinone] 1 beta subcomplex subunit 10-like [Macrosteles quadrilineatus]
MVSEDGHSSGEHHENLFIRFLGKVVNAIEEPVVWFRGTVVEPNRKQYPWYHQKFRRVPTVDQCYDDDRVCKFEAQEQFNRDHKVDSAILSILRYRYENCMMYEKPNEDKCLPLMESYEEAAANWFAKYGDLGFKMDVEKAYMKQKHRMVWERRHGKIGTGTEGNRPKSVEESQGE